MAKRNGPTNGPAKKAKVVALDTAAAQGYRWLDKDPIIDLLMSRFRESDHSYETLAWEAGLSPATIRNWDAGRTRSPQYRSIVSVGLALRLEFGVHQLGNVPEPHANPSTRFAQARILHWQQARSKGAKS